MPLNSKGTGSESESVSELELDPDPVLAKKKAPSTRFKRQLPSKAKPAPSTQSLIEKGEPSKKAWK